MRILIVEDETVACENIIAMLSEIDPELEITGNTESIKQTVKWLQNNNLPDLILMDIHLSDGSAFSIFNRIMIETPVIFTTAYDEYAIEAFKVNSVDYLLKPIKKEDLIRAIDKYKRWSQSDMLQYITRLSNISAIPSYRDKLLVPDRDKLLPVSISEVSCFYTTDKNTRIFLKNGQVIPYPKTLEQIATSLNPTEFIRANKQYLIARSSVMNITIWFDSRLLVTLDVETPEKIYISKNKAAEFKAWMTKEG
ncbi:MAG: LytTR family DNA-binding domain-containing protein [Tannerella sp.]|jgi:DNA-binding LytR/AlgR family response regulator|nr:LytTR family DNA-binding domain-containing protein [Tannerella sp.]